MGQVGHQSQDQVVHSRDGKGPRNTASRAVTGPNISLLCILNLWTGAILYVRSVTVYIGYVMCILPMCYMDNWLLCELQTNERTNVKIRDVTNKTGELDRPNRWKHEHLEK